ncbi:MAG TPA: PDZ domain-containing protein [Opitutaceae bacterium]
MKPTLRPLLSLLALAVALPVLVRADEKTPPKPAKSGKKEMRVTIAGADAPKVETEPAAFLGVSTGHVSAALTEQLGLLAGMGLIVNAVVPDSPAAAALKRHDVLLKLNDQMLINAHQLAVLVRTFKEGDEITLTYVRAGKEATAKVKLAKRDLPKLPLPGEGPVPGLRAWGFRGPGAGELRDMPFGQLHRLDDLPRGEADRLLETFEDGQRPESNAFYFHNSGVPPVARALAMGAGSLVFSDDEGSLEIHIEDGARLLTAKDAAGAVLFDGPVTTPKERAAVPEAVRKRLEQLEATDTFRFRTDADFEGGEVDVVVPRAEPISLPRARRAPVPARMPAGPAALRLL